MDYARHFADKQDQHFAQCYERTQWVWLGAGATGYGCVYGSGVLAVRGTLKEKTTPLRKQIRKGAFENVSRDRGAAAARSLINLSLEVSAVSFLTQ